MPKIQETFYYRDGERPKYEVYGVRNYKRKINEYFGGGTEEVTEFLIYRYGDWVWVDSKDFEPAE